MCNIYSNSYVFKKKKQGTQKIPEVRVLLFLLLMASKCSQPSSGMRIHSPQRPCRHDTLARSHCNAFFGPVKGGVELHEA